jgi:hypothetical protein
MLTYNIILHEVAHTKCLRATCSGPVPVFLCPVQQGRKVVMSRQCFRFPFRRHSIGISADSQAIPRRKSPSSPQSLQNVTCITHRFTTRSFPSTFPQFTKHPITRFRAVCKRSSRNEYKELPNEAMSAPHISANLSKTASRAQWIVSVSLMGRPVIEWDIT